MRLRGIVQSATLVERPEGSDRIELVLNVQGVGPGQPRTIVVPFELLVQDEGLEPEAVTGRGFDADAEPVDDRRWVVRSIAFAARVLRPAD